MLKEFLTKLYKKSSSDWTNIGRENAVEVVLHAIAEVPAYRDFLIKENFISKSFSSFDDFERLPIMNKANYLKSFAYESLVHNGTLASPLVYTSTSGSTGEPFYFPRGEKLDNQYATLASLFLAQDNISVEGDAHLVVVCFGMGVWIGGLFSYKAFEIASREHNYPVSIITPGINKIEIIKVLKNLAPKYKRTTLVGYPPFIKDVIDEAVRHNIDLEKLSMRFVFAAEIFSEEFRNYLILKAGLKYPYRDILHIYGSADIGAMAWETGPSIIVKQLALKNPKVAEILFGSTKKLPTLGQYDPRVIMFEQVNSEVVLTGDNTIPLVRYSIGDHGGVFSFDELRNRCSAEGVDIDAIIEDNGCTDITFELPFVYVFERSDMSVTLYGLQIYPEYVRTSLHNPSISDQVTGKFVLETKYDVNQNQYLEISIELSKGISISPEIEKKVSEVIHTHLCKVSSEYNELHGMLKERARPKIILFENEHPDFFRPGIKQQWVKK